MMLWCMSMISIADALFSKTQQKVLGMLFGNPAQRFYTNEIIRYVAMGGGTVTRELDRMRAADMVSLIPKTCCRKGFEGAVCRLKKRDAAHLYCTRVRAD